MTIDQTTLTTSFETTVADAGTSHAPAISGTEHNPNKPVPVSWQLDMFTAADPLIGIEVNLPRHCQCGHDTLHIGPGRGPHRGSLHCALCQRHCGWLSSESAKFICSVIEHFGRPTAPVCVRVPPRATAESQIVAHSLGAEAAR
jgi:hypothetical protein